MVPFPTSTSIEEEKNIHVDNQFHNHPAVSSQTHIFQDGTSAKGGAQITLIFCVSQMTANTDRITHHVSAAGPPLSSPLCLQILSILLFSHLLMSLDDCLIQSRMAPNHNLQTKNSSSPSSQLEADVCSNVSLKLVSPGRSWIQP